MKSEKEEIKDSSSAKITQIEYAIRKHEVEMYEEM